MRTVLFNTRSFLPGLILLRSDIEMLTDLPVIIPINAGCFAAGYAPWDDYIPEAMRKSKGCVKVGIVYKIDPQVSGSIEGRPRICLCATLNIGKGNRQLAYLPGRPNTGAITC